MTGKRNGAILIASLWILAILSILAMGIGFRISIEARISKYNMDRTKALYLARAGFYKASELLSKKAVTDPAPDTLRRCGIILKDDGDPENSLEGIFTNVKLGDGRFTVGSAGYPGVSDEERRLNINTADKMMLARLLNSLNNETIAEAATTANTDIASAIVAWRTSSVNASPENASEDNYYKSLERPYERKKGNFSAVEELMLVRGVTPRIFDLLKDYVTVYGDKININTAPDKVLLAVGLTANIIGQITRYRNGPDGIAGTEDDGELAALDRETIGKVFGGQISPQDIAIVTNSFTIQSKYFRIESKGLTDSSKIEKRIICIVRKEQGKWPKLESYREY